VASGANALVVADKDWLQATSTTNISWNDFDTIFDTDTGACDVVSCVIGGTIDLIGCVWASKADVSALFDRYLFSAGVSGTNIDQYADVVVDALDQLFDDFCHGGRTSRLSRGSWTEYRASPSAAPAQPPRPGGSPWLAAQYGRRRLVLQAPARSRSPQPSGYSARH
jgi:hypothetical protein